MQETDRVAPRREVRRGVLLVAVLLLASATACSRSGAREDVLDAIKQRGESAGRTQPPYRSLVELLPNTKYQRPGGKPMPEIESAIVGRVMKVEPGRAYRLPEGDSPVGVPTDFEDPGLAWRTVHATVDVEQSLAGPVPGGQVTVGFAFGSSPSFEEIDRGLRDLGRLLLFLEKSPVFAYADRIYGVELDGGLLGVIDDEGRISLPAAGNADQGLLQGAGTMQELTDAARAPERVIRVNDQNERLD